VALAGGHSAASYRAVAEDDVDDPDYVVEHPDTLWRGVREGGALRFDDITQELGFGDVEDHYGQAAADFDGDGFLDLVVGASESPVRLWMIACGAGAWVEVDFAGPAWNRAGWNARVTVEADGRTQTRELLGARGFGQGPSRLHFGLGDVDTVDRLVVRWPDGTEDEHVDLPVRAVFVARHPDAD